MPAPTAQTLWNVPYQRNPFFTGREDVLNQLHRALYVESAVALSHPQGISGLGGIGKTQTALEYAYRYREEYDAVFWIHADSTLALTSSLIELAHLLELPERNEQDQNVVIEAVWRWLRLHATWLMIFDNMDDLTLAEPFLPKVGRGHLLFTTRAHALGGIAERLEVPTMESETGALLLLRRANLLPLQARLDRATSNDYNIACEISQELDGLPLAIDQAGAYVKETLCTLADYLSLYQKRRLDLLQTRGSQEKNYPASVVTTWSLSFEKVTQANPASVELLNLCAFLAPDAIPRRIFALGAPYLGDLLAPVASDPLQFNLACKEALRFSLIARETEKQTITMHRLVQAVIRDGMEREEQCIWVERVMRSINSALPNIDAAAQHELRIYLPHMLTCTFFIKDWSIKTEEAKTLLGDLISCSYRINDFFSCLNFANQALENYPKDARLYIWRGIAFKYLRDYQHALDDMNVALDLDPSSAWGYTHRAQLYMESKDYQHALDDMNVAIYLDPSNVGMRVHQALAYVCINDYQSALDGLNAAVTIEPNNAWVHTHRARLYGRLNNYQRAFDDMQVAFSLDPHNAFIYVHRALLYTEMKDYQHALDDLDNAVSLDPSSAWVHIHRARLYSRLNNYQRALDDVNRGITLEPNNPWVYVQRALLVYKEIKDYQQALQDLDQALELGPINSEYLIYRAITHRDSGDYQSALRDLNLALVINAHEALAYIERALTYKALKDYQEALQDLNRAGEITPDDARIYIERGTLYTLMGDTQQAQADIHRGRRRELLRGAQSKEPW
jgi:tetratricopeptide (TPR) repeat protein